ncbi:MAG: NUDIX domain-containing protein [Patescibacteria group bacterium]
MKKIVPKDAVLIPDNAKCVFRGQIYDVYQWPQKMFDDSIHTFEMLRRPDTIAVIAIVNNKILILDDEQPHIGSRKSLPTGRVDNQDTDTLSAAKREVLEETGFEFKEWRLIEVTQPHSKLEWFIYFYIAWAGKKTAEPHLDAGEKIKVEALAFVDVKKLVLDKAGYLGESLDIFEKVSKIEELLKLPQFDGVEINR